MGDFQARKYLDGVTAGTATASKALISDSNNDLTGLRNLTISGNFVAGSNTISTAEIAVLDGVTAGTLAASKALVVDANKKINELDITALKVNGASLASATTVAANSTTAATTTATTAALANALKTTVNDLIAKLKTAGIVKSS